MKTSVSFTSTLLLICSQMFLAQCAKYKKILFANKHVTYHWGMPEQGPKWFAGCKQSNCLAYHDEEEYVKGKLAIDYKCIAVFSSKSLIPL